MQSQSEPPETGLRGIQAVIGSILLFASVPLGIYSVVFVRRLWKDTGIIVLPGWLAMVLAVLVCLCLALTGGRALFGRMASTWHELAAGTAARFAWLLSTLTLARIPFTLLSHVPLVTRPSVGLAALLAIGLSIVPIVREQGTALEAMRDCMDERGKLQDGLRVIAPPFGWRMYQHETPPTPEALAKVDRWMAEAGVGDAPRDHLGRPLLESARKAAYAVADGKSTALYTAMERRFLGCALRRLTHELSIAVFLVVVGACVVVRLDPDQDPFRRWFDGLPWPFRTPRPSARSGPAPDSDDEPDDEPGEQARPSHRLLPYLAVPLAAAIAWAPDLLITNSLSTRQERLRTAIDAEMREAHQRIDEINRSLARMGMPPMQGASPDPGLTALYGYPGTPDDARRLCDVGLEQMRSILYGHRATLDLAAADPDPLAWLARELAATTDTRRLKALLACAGRIATGQAVDHPDLKRVIAILIRHACGRDWDLREPSVASLEACFRYGRCTADDIAALALTHPTYCWITLAHVNEDDDSLAALLKTMRPVKADEAWRGELLFKDEVEILAREKPLRFERLRSLALADGKTVPKLLMSERKDHRP
jgi:hypothetical protein